MVEIPIFAKGLVPFSDTAVVTNWCAGFNFVWAGSVYVDVTFTDGQVHQLAIYAFDFSASENETFLPSDFATQNILDQRAAGDLTQGKYFVWADQVLAKATPQGTLSYSYDLSGNLNYVFR